MNIEEERKAFIQSAKTVHHDFSGYPDNCIEFQIWLAAKAHATEMEKTELTIEETVSGKIGLFAKSAFAQFESKEEAIEWAKENGFGLSNNG